MPDDTAAISDSRIVRNERPSFPCKRSHASRNIAPAIGHVVTYAVCPLSTRVSDLPPTPPVKPEYFFASATSAIGIANVASAR